MRKVISFNRKWDIVNLPHTWNAIDGQDGDNDFYRGTCYYAKQFMKPSRTFRSDAVNMDVKH